MTLSERLDVRDIPSDVVYDGKQALTFVNTDVPDVMVLDLKHARDGRHGGAARGPSRSTPTWR